MTDLFSALTANHVVESNEGGAVFRVTDEVALRRFLVAGSFGTFYTSAPASVERWADRVDQIVARNPRMALSMLLEVSRGRLAVSRDPSLFLLARLMMPQVPLDVRRDAGRALRDVAVTGTDLLHFMAYRYGGRRRSNRTFREAVRGWFESRSVGSLALQAVKYDQRDGWSMRDVLRLVRPSVPEDQPMRDLVYRWMARPEARLTIPHATIADVPGEASREDAARLLMGYSDIRMPFTTPASAARIIRDTRLPREAVPGELLKSREVWEALKQDMPAQALLRNLGKLSSMGLIDSTDAPRILSSGSILHPYQVLLAKLVYDTGRGVRGSLSWDVQHDISEALEQAFHAAFGTLEVDERQVPLVAMDVSGSMRCGMNEIITPILAEAALAMILAKQYPNASFVTFSGGRYGSVFSRRERSTLEPIGIHSHRLDGVLKNLSIASGLWGWTEINLPFEEAERDSRYTSAIVLTDNETGNKELAPKVIRRIQQDRPEFRAAVVALEANEISVLNPHDARQADFAGADASLPRLLTMFLDGQL